jgi:glycosyltransferase
MKISIITTAFNNHAYIGDCIRSVITQTYANLEYIIVDGGSTDGTLDIIRKHEHRISKWVSEPDRGIYDAMNKGIKMATGDIIGFLHSDDFYSHENVIAQIAEAFMNSDVHSVYGDLVYVSKTDGKVVRYWRSQEFKEGLIKWGWMPPHPTFFVKKDVYDTHGCFNTSLKIAADYELILRFLAKRKITTYYIPEVLIKMRLGGISNGSFKNIVTKTLEDYEALKINGLHGASVLTLFFKNVSKLPQFFIK